MTTTFDAVDAVYARYREAEHIPGLVYGVVHQGRLAHVKGIGLANVQSGAPVQPETFFRIASMTKVVTALAVLLLRDRGALALDDEVTRWVPGFASVRLPTTDSRPILLRDLLMHLGGLVTDDPWGDRHLGMPPAEFDRLLAEGLEFGQPPRLDYEYSNLGFALLGRAVEKASGRPYSAFVRDELLLPLGMKRTTFEYRDISAGELAMGHRWHDGKWTAQRLEPDGAFGAMGGLVTNAVEYGKFIAFLLDGWPARDGAESGPLARASRRELALAHSAPRVPALHTRQGRPVATANAYGYGVVNSVETEIGRTINHRGGLPGYGSHFLFSPETQVGIFSFGNRTYAAMNEPNVEAAAVLKESGLWAIPRQPVSRHLAPALEAVARIYKSGRMEEAGFPFAENLLLDASAEERNGELAKLAAKLGALQRVDAEPIHALHTKLVLTCANGKAKGELILTGERTPRIQTLDLEAVAGA